ncbi:MAG: hypothetical protein ABI758_04555 [Candidatus Woesebacteria bacterium]
MTTVWEYWDCRGCGTKGLRGDLKCCPNCGYACRGESDWYLPANLRVPVTDPDTLRALKDGPDWKCGSCMVLNPIGANFCTHCGAEKGSGEQMHQAAPLQPDSTGILRVPESYRQAPIGYSHPLGQPERHFSPDSLEEHSEPQLAYNRNDSWTESKPSFDWDRLKIPALIGIVLLAVAAIVFFVTRTHETPLKVIGFSWQRIVHIQKYDWGDTNNLTGCPLGSRNCDTRWEVIGNHQVLDHYNNYDTQSCHSVPDGDSCHETCSSNGNGSADCSQSCTTNYTQQCEPVHHSDPVYRTVDDYGNRYYYQIQWWMDNRSPTTSASDRKPFWPEIVLATGDVPEREVSREESYTITYETVEEKSMQFSKVEPYNVWIDYDQKGQYVAIFNNVGVLQDVKDAQTKEQ